MTSHDVAGLGKKEGGRGELILASGRTNLLAQLKGLLFLWPIAILTVLI